MKPSKGTITRTLILALTIINSFLAIFGKSPLPIDSETVTQVVSFCFTVAAAIAAWWKNNSFTKEAMEGDIVMHMLKKGADKSEEVGEVIADELHTL